MYTIAHAIAGYFFLLLVVRVLRRRPGAQMTPFEFVLVFLMGGVIILATVGDDRSETNAVCGVIAVGLMHRIVSFFKQRFAFISALVDGKPVVLIKNGEWQTEAMKKVHVEDDDVMAAARTKGVRSLERIQYAILERIGSISIIKRET